MSRVRAARIKTTLTPQIFTTWPHFSCHFIALPASSPPHLLYCSTKSSHPLAGWLSPYKVFIFVGGAAGCSPTDGFMIPISAARVSLSRDYTLTPPIHTRVYQQYIRCHAAGKNACAGLRSSDTKYNNNSVFYASSGDSHTYFFSQKSPSLRTVATWHGTRSVSGIKSKFKLTYLRPRSVSPPHSSVPILRAYPASARGMCVN